MKLKRSSIFFVLVLFICSLTGLTHEVLASQGSDLFDRSSWDSLSSAEKVEKIDSYELESESLRYKEIEAPAFKTAIDEMAAIVLAEAGRGRIESDLENMESIFTIGKPKPTFISVYKLENGSPIAISLGLYQDGGSTKSRSGAPPKKHYSTEAEAKKDGLDVGADVNWQVHSYFEWDGKTWKKLKIDIRDEGGFSWSGW